MGGKRKSQAPQQLKNKKAKPSATTPRQFPIDTLLHVMGEWYHEENTALQQKVEYYMSESAKLAQKNARLYRDLEMFQNTETILFRELDLYVDNLHNIFEENEQYRQRFSRQVLFDDLPVPPNLQTDESETETEIEEMPDDSDTEATLQFDAAAEADEEHRRLERLLFDSDGEN